MLTAVLFDLDGTLIDTNGMHVRAWHDALRSRGYNVNPDRISVEIGKGGDHLVTDLLGASAETEDGDALRRAHDRSFTALADGVGIAPMPGARRLLEALHERGVKLALATSSGKDMLELCERTSKIPWRRLVDVVVDADDVEASKPDPDIVATSVAKLGVTPAECMMFGDTIWDAQSAKQAGVVLVGLTCGGNGEVELLRAGARSVMRDPADVLATLDDVVRGASPGSARLDAAQLDELMGYALVAAEEALERGEVPIGSAIVRGDGTLVATGWNRFVETGDRAAHAEIDALHAAAGKIPTGARDTIMISTLEPCVMCLGAAMVGSIDAVIYGLRACEDGGTSRVQPPQRDEDQMPRIVGSVRAEQCRALFERWLEKPSRNPEQEAFVRSLLDKTGC